MKWYSIRNVDEGSLVGLIFESDTGGLAAMALDDDGGSDSAKRAVDLLMKRPRLFLSHRLGSAVVARSYRPKDPGYGLALVLSLGFPLAVGPHGTMRRMGSPEDMVRRVWKTISEGSPMPTTMTMVRGVGHEHR